MGFGESVCCLYSSGIEGRHVTRSASPVGPALSKVLWLHGAIVVGLPRIFDCTADGCNGENFIHRRLCFLHIGSVVGVSTQVDEAIVQDGDCLRMRGDAVREVDVTLPIELIGRVEVARSLACVAISNQWVDVPDVEGCTFVPSIGCLIVCRLSIRSFPHSSSELVGGISSDDSYETFVDNILPERVRLALTDTGPIQACDDVVVPHGVR